MGIDHIGRKGPPAAPSAESARVDPGQESGRAFEVAGPHTVPPGHGAPPIDTARTALERYRAGEVDLEGYLDLKVDEATSHLGVLPPQHLEAIRNALRERIAGDATLVELVRIATGQAPERPVDE
jgi:hypothetical protein